MNTQNELETHYRVDGKWLTLRELALALYHIGRNTEVSRTYTLKFVSDALLRASEVLLESNDASSVQSDEETAENEAKGLTEAEFIDKINEEAFKNTWCEYHQAYHDGFVMHECPKVEGRRCGCCDSGRQQCLKKKSPSVDIWKDDLRHGFMWFNDKPNTKR